MKEYIVTGTCNGRRAVVRVFAYGHKLLNGEGELFLIYPKTAHFIEPIADPFCFSEVLKLWVVPFDLELDRVIWPKDISLNMGEA